MLHVYFTIPLPYNHACCKPGLCGQSHIDIITTTNFLSIYSNFILPGNTYLLFYFSKYFGSLFSYVGS